MNKKGMLVQLNIKKAFHYIPLAVLGTLVMGAILGMLVYGVILYEARSGEESAKMPVALVVEDENPYTDMAVSYITGEKTVNDLCDITRMSREEAVGLLNEGKVEAIVLVPENFMNGVLTGDNIPARIILDKAGVGTKSGQFRSLIAAAALDLGVTQAAIYAVDELCVELGIDAIEESEDYLNVELFKYFMRRSRVLDVNQITATGDLSLVEFYVAVLVVLLLFLIVIVCGKLFIPEHGMFDRILAGKERMGDIFVTLSELHGVILGYYVLLAGLYLCLCLAGFIPFHWASPVILWFVISCVFTIGMFLCRLAGNQVTAALTVFLYTMVDLFTAGNLVPAVFLPELVNRIGMFFPTRYIVRCMGGILTGVVDWKNCGIVLLIAVIFFGGIIIVNRLKNKVENS
ncbi:MAG: ABC transporter permease [Lachnospiraceae bacterium]